MDIKETHGQMDRQIDGWVIDRQMIDGQIDGWMIDRWIDMIDGWMDRQTIDR